MSDDNRRKVRVLCYTEMYLDELDEGHVFQIMPISPEETPNLEPSRLLRLSMSTKHLTQKYRSEKIEAEVISIGTRHCDKIRIESIQSLKSECDD